MKIYHSFWEYGYRKMDDYLYDMHKLSVLTSLKSHGNIHLITTKTGKEFLGDLPYTSIQLFENEPPKEYWRIWALGKLFAYQQLIKNGEPFIHIDYDVFLFGKLPSNIMNSRVAFQSKENSKILKNGYDLENFKSKCFNLFHISNTNVDYAFNAGIFGGNDLNTLSIYISEVMKLIFDKENKSLFTTDSLNIESAYSTITEQYYLAVILNLLNIDPILLFNDFDNSETEYYTHLMSSKNLHDMPDRIKSKIFEYEN